MYVCLNLHDKRCLIGVRTVCALSKLWSKYYFLNEAAAEACEMVIKVVIHITELQVYHLPMWRETTDGAMHYPQHVMWQETTDGAMHYPQHVMWRETTDGAMHYPQRHDRVAQLQTLCHPVTLCFCCWCLLVFCCCFCCWCLVVFCCCFCCFSKDRLLGCRLLSQLYLWVLKSNQAIQDQVKSCRASQDQKPLAHWASHDFAFFDD